MAGLQLSGLASGFDWKSVVDQLIELERVPQNRLRTNQSANTSKLTVFSSLSTKLTALQDASGALSATSLFSQRRVSLGDSDLNWTATAASGATEGEYAFNVTRLASRSIRTGAANVAGGLSASNDVSSLVLSEARLGTAVSAGVFTVNGAQVQIETTDTLEDVFARISTATGGSVTASYDASTDRVTLASASPITLGSAVDTSNFLYAFKLYNNGASSITSSASLGTASLNDTIAASGLGAAITAVDGDGAGSFSINGVVIEFNVNTDSIRGVVNRANSSAAGVTMAYDAVNDRFTLTNKGTGDLGISVSESAGGLLDALGLAGAATVARGTNAEFTVNGGGTIVSATNSLDASVHGITGLTVAATSLGEQSISIGSDTAALEAGIRSFVAKFNDIQAYIDEQTKVSATADGKVTAGLMAGNRELSSIARELRSRVFSEVGGLTGAIKRLEAIGIDFEGSSSQLAIRDEAALTNALSNNLAGVSALFSTGTTGLSARISSYATTLVTTGGVLDIQEDSLERQNRSLDTQIADIERRLGAERTRLEASFIRMEEAQSLMSSQLAALQSTLGLG